MRLYCYTEQGEVEIKDADEAASQVRIEIEKTGPSELQTNGVTVNHTLFDVGHGSIFVLQLVRILQTFCIDSSLHCVALGQPDESK